MPIIDKSKPWKVNRKSWHYKVYDFAREAPHTRNFCNYFWRVVYKLALAGLAAAMVLFLLLSYVIAWINHPVHTAIGTAIGVAIIGLFAYMVHRSEKKRKSGNDEPNIVKQWVHTKKEKYCPAVEYVD